MTQSDRINDEDLVAYLDGALDSDARVAIEDALANDPQLAARLAALDVDLAALRDGMDALLSEHRPAELPAASVPAAQGSWRVAACAALVVLSVAVGWGVAKLDQPADWHQAVADYQALYTSETVTAVPQTDAQRAAGLATVSNAIGLELTEDRIAVEGLQFQRAQLLEWQGRPLAQLVYLDDRGRPIAFCIMRDVGTDTNRTSTELAEMSAVTWRLETLAYIVIGPVERELVETAAERLWLQMPG